MPVLIASAVTGWLTALLAIPRSPRVGNEVEELVYARLLGRQQRLLLLAFALTAATLVGGIATLPRHIDPDLRSVREARQTCTYPPEGGPICLVLQPGGSWARAQAERDGSWWVVPTVTGPALPTSPYDDPRTRNR